VVFHVGHVMVDNLLFQRDQLDAPARPAWRPKPSRPVPVRRGHLHRPPTWTTSNLRGIAGALRIAADLPLIFPVHPRTRGNLEKFGLDPAPTCT
jgi:UDP-N-acetylglucosamine 2-epimerase (non-hydrolysing)